MEFSDSLNVVEVLFAVLFRELLKYRLSIETSESGNVSLRHDRRKDIRFLSAIRRGLLPSREASSEALGVLQSGIFRIHQA